MHSLKKILENVKRIAKQAGDAIMFYYGKDLPVEYKAQDSPLTKADIESNKIIVQELEKYDYGILSEELADDKSRINKERVWIVDPMDGTSDFVKHTNEFAVMIGLVENGKPIFGVVYMPVRFFITRLKIKEHTRKKMGYVLKNWRFQGFLILPMQLCLRAVFICQKMFKKSPVSSK